MCTNEVDLYCEKCSGHGFYCTKCGGHGFKKTQDSDSTDLVTCLKCGTIGHLEELHLQAEQQIVKAIQTGQFDV